MHTGPIIVEVINTVCSMVCVQKIMDKKIVIHVYVIQYVCVEKNSVHVNVCVFVGDRN